MAFVDMFAELHGSVPKAPIAFCKTLVNRAFRDIQRKNKWSWQLFDANWVSSNLTGNATNNATLSCNVTQGNNQVVFNAAANTAIAAIGNYPNPVTKQQFRVGTSTIYNIWAYNNTSATATLDRAYTDTSANNSAFTIGSYYFPVPYNNFTEFISVVDMVDFLCLNLNRTREQINGIDPQRTMYFFPTDVVPYTRDLNANSNTYGYMLYELWGNPQTQRAYQLTGLKDWADLVNNSDTLPQPLGEDCVLALAKVYLYEWAEASKGDNPRDQGPDFRFLIGMEQENYDRLFREYRRRDREAVDNWFSIRRPGGFPYNSPFYNSIGATAWPGLPWG